MEFGTSSVDYTTGPETVAPHPPLGKVKKIQIHVAQRRASSHATTCPPRFLMEIVTPWEVFFTTPFGKGSCALYT